MMTGEGDTRSKRREEIQKASFDGIETNELII